MASKEFEKAEQELERILETSKKLALTNTQLVEQKEIFEQLVKDIGLYESKLAPSMRSFLEDIRAIRMSIGREVVDFLKSSRELKELTANTKELVAFCQAVDSLTKILTPETIEKLRNVLKEK